MNNISATTKLILHGIVNIGANGAILALLPGNWKIIALLIFNLAQVGYAYFDPTYVIHLLQTGQLQMPAPKPPTPPQGQ